MKEPDSARPSLMKTTPAGLSKAQPVDERIQVILETVTDPHADEALRRVFRVLLDDADDAPVDKSI